MLIGRVLKSILMQEPDRQHQSFVITVVSEGVNKLASDLQSGVWSQNYGHLLDKEESDFGYRLVVAPKLS